MEEEKKDDLELELSKLEQWSIYPDGSALDNSYYGLNPLDVDLIIRKMLSFLDITSLKVAREVNRDWNQIAAQFFNPFCSKKALSFNEDNYWTNARNYGIGEMKDFIQLALMGDSCPFSTFDIGTSIIKSANENIVSEFLEICGPFMKHLTIREDSSKPIFRRGLPKDLNFQRLRSLRIHLLQALPQDILENFFDLVRLVINSAPNLQHLIIVSHHGFDGGECIQSLLDILAESSPSHINHLEIEAQMNDAQLVEFSTLGLKLNILSLDFWGSRLTNADSVKMFLKSQSETLEYLRIADEAMSSLFSINFPPMKKLRYLKIKGSMLGRITVSFPSISFIEQFPNLKSLAFSMCFGEWEEFLKGGIKPSSSVEELKLPWDFMDSSCLHQAAYLFPRLKRLEVPHYQDLMDIVYSMMINLEELTINTRDVSLVDDILTGIPLELCEEINQNRNFNTVLKNLEDYQVSKSITCLKKLKKLTLKCKRTSDPVEITEVSCYISFLEMENLQYLDFGLRPLMLSRDCFEEITQRFHVISLHS